MEIKIIASILLTFRVIAVVILCLVTKRQVQLVRETNTDYGVVRWILLSLVAVTLFGNVIPILIDVATILFSAPRANPSPLGVTYALSNAVTAMVTAFGWLVLYRSVAEELAASEKEHDELVADNKSLVKDNKELKKNEKTNQ